MTVLLFDFVTVGSMNGGVAGESFLIFAQHLGLKFMMCLAKIFGHRQKTIHRIVF